MYPKPRETPPPFDLKAAIDNTDGLRWALVQYSQANELISRETALKKACDHARELYIIVCGEVLAADLIRVKE